MPGGGAGSLDDVIRLYIAWGRSFIVLLDADKEGLAQKDRYKDLFGKLVDDRVFSLEDIDSDWKRKGTEFLIEEEDRLQIQSITYPDSTKFNKSNFNRSVQELYLTKQQVHLSESTKSRFAKVIGFCNNKLTLQL